MHRKIFGKLLAACWTLIWSLSALANPPAPPPPIPSPPPITFLALDPPRVQPHRVATVTLSSDSSVVLTRAASGKFQIVAARPGETMTIVVPTPVTPPVIPNGLGTLPTQAVLQNTVIVQPLDGGYLLQAASVPIVRSAATFQFQVGQHPGLYRVQVLGLGPAATLQFWVQDVQRPATNPWAVNAAHWEAR